MSNKFSCSSFPRKLYSSCLMTTSHKTAWFLILLFSYILIFQGILLTGAVLDTLTCGEGGNSEISKILLVPEKQQAVLQAYQTTVCGGGAGQRAELFGKMSEELRAQIDTQRVFDQVHAGTTFGHTLYFVALTAMYCTYIKKINLKLVCKC